MIHEGKALTTNPKEHGKWNEAIIVDGQEKEDVAPGWAAGSQAIYFMYNTV